MNSFSCPASADPGTHQAFPRTEIVVSHAVLQRRRRVGRHGNALIAKLDLRHTQRIIEFERTVGRSRTERVLPSQRR